ncbi:DUF421 domain-containing protein [bacterium 210820-DFI.6.37]|nr:DUF421 domain-containing protein [bacterium 210820-DFI.6.37]
MAIILVRTVILYAIVLFTIRIMGKSELSKMSPFQLVVIFMIAELASIPIESSEASLIKGAAGIFTLMFLQILISIISIKSEKFKNFINGKPSILIEKGKINEQELKKLRISLNDLLEQLRIEDSPALSDVEYAVMESNGELSVIPKADKKPLTASDMGLSKEPEVMPLILIADGVLYRKNLLSIGWDEVFLKEQMAAVNLASYKEVFFAFCDEKKQLHIYISSPDKKKAQEVTICATS